MSLALPPHERVGRDVLIFLSLLVLVVLLLLGWDNRLVKGADGIKIPQSVLRVELGRKLFFDKRMSADGSTSCSTCHDPKRGWTDGRPVAEGMAQHFLGPRNTPTVLMASRQSLQFADQRTDSLEEQATQPLTNALEMGNQSVRQVADRLNNIPGYRTLFLAAYGELARRATIADAIASFERSVTIPDPAVNRYLEGDQTALSDTAKRGFEIFKAAQCIECHQPPDWRDQRTHNTGVAFRFNTGDQGRAGVLGGQAQADDFRAFKTPTLVGILYTAPYMHAGSIDTLEAVVDHYDRGAVNANNLRDRRLDPRVRPLGLNPQQKKDLITFLAEGFLSPNYPDYEPPTLPR